jgi:thiol-disulfide isomerase/thioredoxin
MRATFDVPVRAGAAALDRIMASGHPALVVFETLNCGPCQALRPLLDELAEEFRRRMLVVRVTDTSEGWLAARYHLVFVPTLVFWRGGRELARIKGNPGRGAIREHVRFLLDGEVPPEPAEGPRHTLRASFGPPPSSGPRALLFAPPA